MSELKKLTNRELLEQFYMHAIQAPDFINDSNGLVSAYIKHSNQLEDEILERMEGIL